MRTLVPGAMLPTIGGRSLAWTMAVPSTERITSPTSMPASSAGLPGWMLLTSAPRVSGRSKPAIASRLTGPTVTPTMPRWTVPVSLICSATFMAMSIGIAKLTPW